MKNKDFIDIIEFAVEREIEAYEFYKDAEKKVKSESLRDLFKDLAKEELEHRKFLKDFLKSDAEKIKLNEEYRDFKISETIDKPKLSVEMEFSDAIALAIKNEEEAMDMYKDLAEACIDQKEKDLFLGLMNMEQMHKAKLEEVYVNAAFGEVW